MIRTARGLKFSQGSHVHNACNVPTDHSETSQSLLYLTLRAVLSQKQTHSFKHMDFVGRNFYSDVLGIPHHTCITWSWQSFMRFDRKLEPIHDRLANNSLQVVKVFFFFQLRGRTFHNCQFFWTVSSKTLSI